MKDLIAQAIVRNLMIQRYLDFLASLSPIHTQQQTIDQIADLQNEVI